MGKLVSTEIRTENMLSTLAISYSPIRTSIQFYIWNAHKKKLFLTIPNVETVLFNILISNVPLLWEFQENL